MRPAAYGFPGISLLGNSFKKPVVPFLSSLCLLFPLFGPVSLFKRGFIRTYIREPSCNRSCVSGGGKLQEMHQLVSVRREPPAYSPPLYEPDHTNVSKGYEMPLNGSHGAIKDPGQGFHLGPAYAV